MCSFVTACRILIVAAIVGWAGLAPAQETLRPAPRPRPEDRGPSTQGRPVGPNGKTNEASGRPAEGAPGQGAGPRTLAEPRGEPQAPFILTPAQQQLLDTVLAGWENRSSSVKTFKCAFKRYEYDPTLFDPKNADEAFKAKHFLKSESKGEIKFATPDRGSFVVSESDDYDANLRKYVKHTEADSLDHWVCDGKAIYEFKPPSSDDPKEKGQVIKHELPEEMRGEAIADGPIPFLFGAKVDKLKSRYWLRDVTMKEQVGKTTLLEAIPRYQRDASNFQSALVLLDDKMRLIGVTIVQPGGKQWTAYSFSSISVNDPLSKILGEFSAPKVPRGWKLVVDPAPSSADEQPQPPAEKREAKAVKPAMPASKSR